MLVDVSCILYVIPLLAQVGDDFGTEGEIKVFQRLCITFVFYLFVDVAWQLVAGGYIAIPREFDYVLCGIGLFAISPVYYFWACFVELRLGSRIDRSRKARMLARPCSSCSCSYSPRPLRAWPSTSTSRASTSMDLFNGWS
jgi:hypothetical protein